MSKETPKPVRCAIYTRKSTEDGLEQEFNSLDAQRESGEAYIASQKAEGWTCLPDRYDDGGFSGGNTDRPAFQRLMADVETGGVDCIVVYKIDRLSRSLMDFARIMQTLEEHGVSLVSVTQQFNTTSSMGRLTLNILLSFAQFEREIISERTRDKIAAARRKGKWTGGPPVLGYDRVSAASGTRLEINRAEAKRVRAIFRKYLELGSMLDVVRACREQGWTTKRYQTRAGAWRGGQPFSKSTLHKLLSNPIYLGKVTYKGQVYDGEHEAIVDEELFGQVQGMIRRNTGSGGKYARNKHNALLKGLVRCKQCGCAMSHHYATRRNKRYRYYVCVRAQKHGWEACTAPSLPAIELENFVIDQIKALGRDGQLVEENILRTQERLQAEIDADVAKRREIEKSVRDLGRQIGELAPRAGYDPAATAAIDGLQAQMREEEQAITRINERIVRTQKRMLDKDELAGAMESFAPLWDGLTPTEKTRLIHLLVDQIEYDGTQEAISITFHPTGIKTLTESRDEAA